MIRHIVLVKWAAPVSDQQVEEILAALVALPAPGRTSFTLGADLGLRPGNLDMAIVADFEDEEAFQAYDRDPAHDRIRRELIAPLAARFERCQYAV